MKPQRWMGIILVLLFSLNIYLPAFAAPVPETPTEGTLEIWCTSTYVPVFQQLTDDLLTAYGVQLIVEEHAAVRDDFLDSIPLGTSPDLVVLQHDQMGYLINNDLINPIDLGPLTSQFLATSIEAITINGQFFGMPLAIEILGFFYNTDLVSTPPTTWDEVQTMGAALQASGDVTYGMALPGATYDTYPLMTAFGGYVFGQYPSGDWNVHDLGMESPGMIAGLQWIVDRVNDGFMDSNIDWNYAHTMFEMGEAPFIMAGPWALDRIRASGVPYAITAFPSQVYAGSPFMSVQTIAINALSENTAIAQTFLTEFVATEETMTALSVASNRPSAFLPSIANITDPDIQALAAIAATGAPMPSIPEMGFVWAPWNDGVIYAIQGTKSTHQALADASELIRDLIEGVYAGMVNVPGSYQYSVGCLGDWQPNCQNTAMRNMGTSLWMSGPFLLTAGDYECKVALNGGWTINYGVGGVRDGDNYQFTLQENSRVVFTWDDQTHLLTIRTYTNAVFLPSIIK